jgi:hypothetical protein
MPLQGLGHPGHHALRPQGHARSAKAANPKKEKPAKPVWRPFERMALDARGIKYSAKQKDRPTYE